MAMKQCKECGTEISSSAKICPKCGKDQRNFFMKHKAISIILILIILGCIAGATGDNNKSNNKTEETSSTAIVQSDAISEKSNTASEGEGEIGKYYVKIGNHEITKGYNGSSILLVTVAFTNNNDEAKAFLYNLECKAYQNGVELTTPISSYGINNYNWEDKSKEVQSGVTYEFNLAFEVSDTTQPVNIEISPSFSSKYSQKVTKTLEL